MKYLLLVLSLLSIGFLYAKQADNKESGCAPVKKHIISDQFLYRLKTGASCVGAALVPVGGIIVGAVVGIGVSKKGFKFADNSKAEFFFYFSGAAGGALTGALVSNKLWRHYPGKGYAQLIGGGSGIVFLIIDAIICQS